MNKTKLYIALLLPVFLTACSFGNNTVKVEEVKKVKNVAVIMYTVPQDISYKDNARDISKSNFALLAEAVIGDSGNQAANVAVETFVSTLQTQGLPFKVMSHSDVVSNAKFTALYDPYVEPKKPVDESLLGQTLSFLSSATDNKPPAATSPKNMSHYGLVAAWAGDTALTNKPGESDYIKKAIEVLKVDAVLVVNDMGFSFSCEACIGIGGSMSGVGSTGSAFNATLISRAGPVMNIREWFGTTDEQATMVAGIVDPTEYKNLFEEHGRRMAQVYTAAVKESMAN